MEQLHPYMSFRQAFANTYACRLNREKLKHLANEADEILLLVEAELGSFIAEEIAPLMEDEAMHMPD